ncbi:MAG: 1-phosphofructokinase [Ignavibacteriales bacterium]|nr:MAG: 1-phosphofructokinase [Ignavibacteriales bacterium]
MILTVTINPLLERRLTYNSVETGKSNRTDKEYFTAGGKGINVSRQLNSLGIKNLAFTALGGNNGKIYKNLLANEKLEFTFLQTKHETRTAALIVEEDNKRLTTYFGPNSLLEINEVEEFKQRMKKMIENCEIVVFAGSSPCEAADDIFPFGIRTANEYDKISICDTYGKHLQDCIDACPTILHNNVNELNESLGVELNDKKAKLEFLNSLYKKGIRQAFITEGAKPVYSGNFDFCYKSIPPEINEVDATGSGDAFVAGLCYGHVKARTFEEMMRYSIALGALNASVWEVCKVKNEDAEIMSEKISVESIGKKMKTLSVDGD